MDEVVDAVGVIVNFISVEVHVRSTYVVVREGF